MAKRLAFAQEAIQWSRERLQNTVFADEVQATGGAHTVSYVTVQRDSSENTLLEVLTHKYSKKQAWKFQGAIIDGKKGPYQFQEKEQGLINSAQYNENILCYIEYLFYKPPKYWFIQDNAPSHRSRLTKANLAKKGIPTIDWPPYSLT